MRPPAHKLLRPNLLNKKRLPNGAIPGIPRLRAGTGLLSIGNYIASRYFQRSRARTGAGPGNIASYESRAGDEVRSGASDHDYERTGTSDHERKDKRKETAYCPLPLHNP